MKLCDLTLATPEENLACDEVLLDLCEAGASDELLRLWELPQYFVVLGYANKAATEVNLPFCQKLAIPVLRRCTGGGTVLQGPGVLNYSLILRTDDSGPFHSIAATNKVILERHRDVLTALLRAPVEWCGQTDLAIGGLKFAGNAQRRHRRFLLFHGSFLLHLDLSLVEKALPLPSRQPDYRISRSHSDFLINLSIPPHTLKAALAKAWNAFAPLNPIPWTEITRLAREKYALDEWNLRF
jgi:lipoate---protein ligase